MCTYLCIYAVFFSEVVDYTNVAVSVYKRRAESLKQTFYGRKDEEFVKGYLFFVFLKIILQINDLYLQ